MSMILLSIYLFLRPLRIVFANAAVVGSVVIAVLVVFYLLVIIDDSLLL